MEELKLQFHNIIHVFPRGDFCWADLRVYGHTNVSHLMMDELVEYFPLVLSHTEW